MPDYKLPRLINNQLKNGEGDNRHSKMLEDIVSSSKAIVERLEIRGYQDQHNFCGDGEEHEGIGDSLGDEGQFSGLADEDVEDLGDHNAVEICTLSVLDSLGCVADGQVGCWGDLLDLAFAPNYYRFKADS